MPTPKVDVLVIGAGLGGLAIAATAAQRGLSVICVGDGRLGASLANFGQLHSGAVYAPVLPQVAEACWRHRDRWNDLASPAVVGRPHGIALFTTADAVEAYQAAWHRIGISVDRLDAHNCEVPVGGVRPVAAFRIPDLGVSLGLLHDRTADFALVNGVPPIQRRTVSLRRDRHDGLVRLTADDLRPETIVLAAGAETPALLAAAGIEHTLRTRRIAWGRCSGSPPPDLTYWLDGDLLALSPDPQGFRAGLPGANGQYGTDQAELARLRNAISRLYPAGAHQDLRLKWGTVCEPSGHQADPSGLVINLRHPTVGWSTVGNLIVALPGKWTTAWHCADQVVAALQE